MPAQITMPQLSDTMAEGTIVKWLKKEGDKVRAGEIIAEVETDKANMEMESFDAGTLAVIRVREGEKVKVGETIAVLATGSEKVEEVRGQFAATAGGSAAGSKPIAAEARSSESRTSESRVAKAPPAPTGAKKSSNGDKGSDRIRVSPLARRLAAERGIDLSNVRGSGPGGRIVMSDLQDGGQAVAEAPAASKPPMPPRPGTGEKQVVPLTKMRAVIAQRLAQSKQTIPHFYETVDCVVDRLMDLRVRLNQQLESQGVRLSVGDFIAKAVAAALVKHPQLNSTFNGTELTRHGDVHLGMAVALPDGLIVPVLRNIHLMGLSEIRTRSADLVERARAQKLKQDELSGATFTVSNLGSYGVREFSAIINPPEVGILAVGAAEPRPVVRDGAIVPATVVSLSLSADHRVVDGATAAEFLRTLKGLLEEPGLMMV
jgi:pyruvate dehydrogenase E2 component (dihydrolipoamide acetyltransferase)